MEIWFGNEIEHGFISGGWSFYCAFVLEIKLRSSSLLALSKDFLRLTLVLSHSSLVDCIIVHHILSLAVHLFRLNTTHILDFRSIAIEITSFKWTVNLDVVDWSLWETQVERVVQEAVRLLNILFFLRRLYIIRNSWYKQIVLLFENLAASENVLAFDARFLPCTRLMFWIHGNEFDLTLFVYWK